jgi:recombinational DNA repair protein (RecF pathway)
MHTLRVGVDISPGRDLGTLKDASIARVRAGLVGDLASMEAAGAALRWVRRGTAPRTAEPAVWQAISALLDALDARDGDARQQLAAFGVQLLAAAGWGLELEACVRCGKPCPERARTAVDAGAGGVVCRPCGASGIVVSARERRAMIAATTGARFTAPPERAIAIVESALDIHGRGEGT